MNKTITNSTNPLLQLALLTLLLSTNLAHAGDMSLKQFVVTLDNVSGAKLSASQSTAAKTDSTHSPEYLFGVSLQEEFRSKQYWYDILKAVDKQQITGYLSALKLTPVNIIETEFTNSPTVGGGPKAGDVPKENHQIYVIERSVPGISGLPMEKQKEISQGSQSVVAQFGDSLEWDRSYLTQEGTFCVYRTDDEKNIREHAEIAGFPVDKISSTEHIVYNFEFN